MPDSHLLANVVRFARLLRGAGLDVTPAHVRLFAGALALVTLERREDVKATGRAIFARRREHAGVYDRAFDAFWRAATTAEAPRIDLGLLARRVPTQRRRAVAWLPAPGAASELPPDGPAIDVPERRAAWSDAERLARKDFAELSPGELRQVREALEALVLPFPLRRTRRTMPARRGRLADFRRTIRRSLRHGGEPLHLLRRSRRQRARPLVVLTDVSGSMQPYSRILLQFAHVLSRASARCETFSFGTRLTRLTRLLETRDAGVAVTRAARAVPDWDGGTRIGAVLGAFNRRWARRVLGGGAIVLLMSDGWDRGDPDVLSKEMARLKRACHRLIWLNPLLGQEGFEPLTRGLQAALPHVDDFLPVHNLVSLAQLVDTLAGAARARQRVPGDDARRGARRIPITDAAHA